MINIFNKRPKEYKVNSMGYRCPEFDTINWQDVYIIQGCSACFGLGIMDDSDTIAANIERLLGVSTINLGAPGTSIEFQYFNTIEMLEAGIRPKGVFMMYPNADRFTMFIDGLIENIGSWSDDQKLRYALDGNAAQHNLYHGRAIRLFWKMMGVPLVEFAHHGHAKGHVELTYTDRIDLGTDGQHWGPKTAALIAGMISNKMKSITEGT
jgi:hypothetical protein